MSKTYRLIGNRFLGLCVFFIVLKQALVASSTWVIADIGKKLATHQPIIFHLIAYCTLLLIIYLPGTATRVFQEKAIITSLHTYLQKLLHKTYGKPSYYILNTYYKKKHTFFLSI